VLLTLIMATYKCTETDIRALFLESHDDPAPVLKSCPESCEFLFGTKSPQLFDVFHVSCVSLFRFVWSES